MEYLGFSETIINPFRSSNLGNVALAYLMYKLATPARYTVTLAGTNYMVKYLRRTGRMKPKEPSESLRSLAKDSRKELKEKTVQIRSEIAKSKLKVRTILHSKVDRKIRETRTEVKKRKKLLEQQLKIIRMKRRKFKKGEH